MNIYNESMENEEATLALMGYLLCVRHCIKSLSYFISINFTIPPQAYCCYHHATDEENEAQTR